MTLKNISKTTKTILFASLIAAMILPFSGMSYAYAEKTDKELIDEWNITFGNDAKNTAQPNDEIKISVMKGIHLAKNNPQKPSEYEINYYKEQNHVLDVARTLNKMIETENNPAIKSILEKSLKDMEPIMAQVGIFTAEGIDDEKLDSLHDQYQAEKRQSFQSGEFVSKNVGNDTIVVPLSHSGDQYQTQMFLEFACEPYVCRSSKMLDYLNKGESTNALIPIPSNITIPNNLEYRVKIGNFYSGNWQQGYHQGVHYNSNWNYLDGDTANSYKYYKQNRYSQYTVVDFVNGHNGDQTYQYLYFYR